MYFTHRSQQWELYLKYRNCQRLKTEASEVTKIPKQFTVLSGPLLLQGGIQVDSTSFSNDTELKHVYILKYFYILKYLT